jgi:hypothetical protein
VQGTQRNKFDHEPEEGCGEVVDEEREERNEELHFEGRRTAIFYIPSDAKGLLLELGNSQQRSQRLGIWIGLLFSGEHPVKGIPNSSPANELQCSAAQD